MRLKITFVLAILIFSLFASNLVTALDEPEDISEDASDLPIENNPDPDKPRISPRDITYTRASSNPDQRVEQEYDTKSMSSGSYLISTDVAVDHPNDTDLRFDILWTETAIIDGVATNQQGYPFSVTVELYINKSTEDIYNWAVAPDDTYTTGEDGYYTFDIIPTGPSDIGYYNYTVFYKSEPNPEGYEGYPCIVCNTTVEANDYRIKDYVNVTLIVNPSDRDIGTIENYNVSLFIYNSSNLPLTQVQRNALNVTFTETYYNVTHPNIDERITTISGLDPYSKASYVNKSLVAQTLSVTFTAEITGYEDMRAVQIQFDSTQLITSVDRSISNEYIYNLNGTIDGTTIDQQTIPPIRYYRLNQNITINGYLTNQSIVDPSEYTGIQYNVSLTGGGFNTTTYPNPLFTGFTNDTGQFSFWFNLTQVNFTNPNIPITLTATINKTDVDPYVMKIYLKGNASSFYDVTVNYAANGTGYNNNNFWYNNGQLINVSGYVNDTYNNFARGMQLKLYMTNQTQPNETIFPYKSFREISTTTDTATGYFEFLFFFNQEFSSIFPYVTLNISVIDSIVWKNPIPYIVNQSLVSLPYFHSNSLKVDLALYNTTRTVFRPGTFYQTNNTFQQFHDNVLHYYNLTIRDVFGRTPVNITMGLDIDESLNLNTTQYTINSTNNGIFIMYIDNFTNADLTQEFDTYLAEFKYNFIIAELQGNFNVTTDGNYSQTFILYGPDHQPFNVNDFTISSSGNNTNQASNVVVNFDPTNQVALDNIRNVTIYWMVSKINGSDNFSESLFEGSEWQISNMTYDNIDEHFFYEFVFADFGHGRWFKFNITIFDLSGHGLWWNGTTVDGADWTTGLAQFNVTGGIPGYDNNETLSTDFLANGNNYVLKMGDTIIADFNLNDTVTVNGNAVTDPVEITENSDVTVQITLPLDTTGYDNVTLSYRILVWNPDNNNFTIKIGYVNVTMDTSGPDFGLQQQIFYYTIEAGNFSIGDYLDYYFIIYDNAGNIKKTQSSIDESGSDSGVIGLTEIIDSIAPIVDFNNYLSLANPDRNNTASVIQLWANETSIAYTLIYNITDGTGSGLKNITFYWYLNGELVNTTDLVLNGVEVGSSQAVGANYLISVRIPNDYFEVGNIISWRINVTDNYDNLLTVNDGSSGSIRTFEIISQPTPPPQTGITIDPEDTSNALWIVTGFLGVLGLLTLYYQRHNIRELIEKRARRKMVEGTLTELMDEIRRLGAEEKYKRAIMLTWEALERVSREIIQAPRRYNQTAREFASYLSTITIVDRETLLTLSSVYELAKYGRQDPTHDDWDDAVKALNITVRTIIESGTITRIAEDDEDW